MVSLLLFLLLLPGTVLTRGRIGLSRIALGIMLLYYAGIIFFVNELSTLESPWTKSVAVTATLSVPLIVAFRKNTLFWLSSMSAFLMMSMGIFAYFIPENAVTWQSAPVHPVHTEFARGHYNKSQVDRALHILERQPDESLIIDAVQYLRSISGKHIGNDKNRWKEFFQSNKVSIIITAQEKGSTLVERGFSAVKATSIYDIAARRGVEFLPLFISTALRDQITDQDLVELRGIVEARNSKPAVTVPDLFKKGMAYFFLAVGQTVALSDGREIDPRDVNANWHSAIALLKQSQIGLPISASLQRTLNKADANNDSYWTADELLTIARLF